MSVIEVKATKDEKEATVSYDFGDDVNDAVIKFGADVVFSNYRAKAKITLQGIMRRLLETGKSEGDIAARVTRWRPGIAIETEVDPLVSALAKFSKMSPEEQEEYLSQLRASITA